MAFDWTTHTFSSLIKGGVLEIGDGYRAKNDELGGDGPIFLRAGHVSDTGIDFSGVDRFTYPNAVRFGSKLSQVGDVVITTKGNSTGRVTFVTSRMPPFVYSPHLSYWRTKPGSILLPGFLKAWSRSQEFGTQLSALSRSTDMAPYLSLQDQRSLTITVPPVAVQQAISALAIGIDDRIDHNRALADNLEAVARALFKSWFVDFDPVRAKAAGESPPGLGPDLADLFPDRFIDSELGEIPEGWACSPITKIAAVHSGGTPKRAVDEYWGGTIPWYSVVDAPRLGEVFVIETSEHITEAGSTNSAAKTLPHGVTIISARGTVGKLALTCGPMTINQSCYALKGTLGDFFTYFTIAASIDWLKQNVHGAVFDTITRATLDGLLVIHPSDHAARAFEDTVRPIMLRIEACSREARVLSKLRDLLLPRLISGKLRVEDAEAALETT